MMVMTLQINAGIFITTGLKTEIVLHPIGRSEESGVLRDVILFGLSFLLKTGRGMTSLMEVLIFAD